MKSSSKIYFASDLHLGVPDPKDSLEREKRFISWLDTVKEDADEIFLLGDIFDFWFEYSKVVPKGYVRLLGKIAELTDSGIPIHYFTGNHDLWVSDYLPAEVGVSLHRDPIRIERNGKKLFLGHGDGLGPGDKGYKFLKRIFRGRLSKWMFKWVHPDIGVRLANYFSKTSREATEEEEFLGEENEWLVQFSKERLKEEHIDYFIFGHRHIPIDMELDNSGARYINLGDWIVHFTYAEFTEKGLELKEFDTLDPSRPS